jgi:hypothetical protein
MSCRSKTPLVSVQLIGVLAGGVTSLILIAKHLGGAKRMKRIALTLLLVCSAATVSVAAPTCKDKAADKKLAGAALTSFMKKCEKDAASACDSQAADKKLHGAAKTSFTKKCVKDATGM